jgi:DNA-binding transcriptional ArsR family regulator
MKIQEVLEALADPNRRKILELLKSGERSAGEIAQHFEISAASLSHHLNKLKSAELLLSKRRGQNILYSIHTSVFEDMAQLVAELFSLGGKKK